MKAELLSNKRNDGLRTNQDHCTPEFLWKAIIGFAPIVLDPCSNMWSTVPAKQTYNIDYEEDGLELPWPAVGLIYLNPPFGNLRPWIDRCNRHSKEHPQSDMLMVCPFSPPTKWFRAAWEGQLECAAAWPQRVCWEGAGTRPAFYTGVLYWGPSIAKFIEWAEFNDCLVMLPPANSN